MRDLFHLGNEESYTLECMETAEGTCQSPLHTPGPFLGFLRVISRKRMDYVRTPGYSVGKISCVGKKHW